MWTREEAMIVVKAHVEWLRKHDRNMDADAIEYVLYKVGRDESRAHFPVTGAGEVEVGTSGQSRCGSAVGVHFGVSWGSWGYAGGVMDAAVVRQLAEHLLSLVGPADRQTTSRDAGPFPMPEIWHWCSPFGPPACGAPEAASRTYIPERATCPECRRLVAAGGEKPFPPPDWNVGPFPMPAGHFDEVLKRINGKGESLSAGEPLPDIPAGPLYCYGVGEPLMKESVCGSTKNFMTSEAADATCPECRRLMARMGEESADVVGSLPPPVNPAGFEFPRTVAVNPPEDWLGVPPVVWEERGGLTVSVSQPPDVTAGSPRGHAACGEPVADAYRTRRCVLAAGHEGPHRGEV